MEWSKVDKRGYAFFWVLFVWLKSETLEAKKGDFVYWVEGYEGTCRECCVVDKIKVLCMRTSPSHSSPSEPGARITISREEFESLVYKVKESDKLADIKVAAATTTLKLQRLPKTKL